MTRFKRRILIGSAVVLLVLLGAGVWFYFSFFASTSTALRHAEAFLFRRMKVAQLAPPTATAIPFFAKAPGSAPI